MRIGMVVCRWSLVVRAADKSLYVQARTLEIVLLEDRFPEL